MEINKLEQKVMGELFDNAHRDYSCTIDFQDGYERALRLVLQWIKDKNGGLMMQKKKTSLKIVEKGKYKGLFRLKVKSKYVTTFILTQENVKQLSVDIFNAKSLIESEGEKIEV